MIMYVLPNCITSKITVEESDGIYYVPISNINVPIEYIPFLSEINGTVIIGNLATLSILHIDDAINVLLRVYEYCNSDKNTFFNVIKESIISEFGDFLESYGDTLIVKFADIMIHKKSLYIKTLENNWIVMSPDTPELPPHIVPELTETCYESPNLDLRYMFKVSGRHIELIL